MEEILYKERRNIMQKRKLLQEKPFENIGKPKDLWKIKKKKKKWVYQTKACVSVRKKS